MELRLLDHCVHPMCYVMDVITNLRQYYSNSHKITKREDISNPFEVLERQTLEVENIVEKNKYLTILFFRQIYTHLHTCQKSHHPMKKQGKRSKKKHLSKEAFRKIIHKQNMWRVYKHTGKDQDYVVYKEALNAATNEVRKSKRNVELKLAPNIKSDSKSFYAYVRSKQNVRDKV